MSPLDYLTEIIIHLESYLDENEDYWDLNIIRSYENIINQCKELQKVLKKYNKKMWGDVVSETNKSTKTNKSNGLI